MPRCRFCDRNNPAGARKCAGCGAELTPDDESYVESVPARSPAAEPSPGPDGLAAVSDPLERQILSTFATRGKISAIKEFREHTGAGLKEAKDAVEALAARYEIKPARATGCTVSVGGAILLAVAIAKLL